MIFIAIPLLVRYSLQECVLVSALKGHWSSFVGVLGERGGNRISKEQSLPEDRVFHPPHNLGTYGTYCKYILNIQRPYIALYYVLHIGVVLNKLET